MSYCAYVGTYNDVYINSPNLDNSHFTMVRATIASYLGPAQQEPEACVLQ